MNTHTMKMVTIICEALAREPILRLLKQAGAHGFTLFRVEGAGDKGVRTADMEEFSNIQIQVIVPPDVAEKLLARLEKEFFSRFGIVVYESDVRVLRPHKF
jgi:nitrogen regulatory protein PII